MWAYPTVRLIYVLSILFVFLGIIILEVIFLRVIFSNTESVILWDAEDENYRGRLKYEKRVSWMNIS